MTWFDIISFWLILIWLVVLLRAKKKINTPIGVLIYGLILTLKRLLLFVYKSFVRAGRKTKQVVEENIIAAIQTHPYEVSLGKQSSGREFVVNVMDHHSLIGATSGGGKTYMLHHILKQLFDKGRLFFDNTDVYIIDLKGHPTDMLHLWKPLLSGYATRIGNNLDDALGLLQQIESRLGEEVERKILLIIDEAAILTADKKGDELLGNVASQLRLNGSLILLVQSPQYSVVKTFIRYNIPRRMCGLVMSRDQAKIILDYRPKQEELPERIGDYIIREPGKNKLIAVHTPKIELPEAINLTIKNVLGIRSEDLPEMKLLIDIVGPRTRGETITGVRAIASTLEIPNAQNFVMVAYRNFTNAGILDAPKYRGGRYTLAVADVNEAVTKLRDYLPNWMAAPLSHIDEES